MNEQMPSTLSSSDLIQQAELLKEKLAGHKIFAKWRGKLGPSVMDFCSKALIDELENLSQVKKKSSEIFSDIAVLMRILAQLKFSGNEVAFDQMKNALQFKGYRMIGEDIPFEKVTPVTVVMFKPDIMLKVIQWLVRDDDIFQLRTLFQEGWGSTKDSTKELQNILPSLNEVNNQRSLIRNAALYFALEADVLDKFKNEKTQDFFCWLNTLSVDSQMPNQDCGDRSKLLKLTNYSSVAYFTKGTQAEVLSLFERKLQKEIATWQLEIPTIDWNSNCGITHVGMHPENEHDMWKKLYPQYCSKGVNAGVGLMAMPNQIYLENMNRKIELDVEQKECRAVFHK